MAVDASDFSGSDVGGVSGYAAGEVARAESDNGEELVVYCLALWVTGR